MVSRLGRLQRLALAAGAAASLAYPGTAGAADPAFSLHGSVDVGVDSNPRRVFNNVEPPDGMGSALVQAAARVPIGFMELGGSYEAAARKFLMIFSEDTVAQQAGVELAARPLASVSVALDGQAKDRRGGGRQYTDLQGALALRWRAVPELEMEVRGGAHRFINRLVFEYSFSTPELGGRVKYRFNRRHSLSLGGELGYRRYNELVHIDPSIPDPPEVQREDSVLSAAASYAYRGEYQLSAGYRYYSEDSNSQGESVRFHQVDLALGTPLPWVEGVLLFAQLTLQLADYPDGIFLSSDDQKYFLKPDDERHNALILKLARPLGDQVDVELRYGLYLNVLPENDLFFLRQVASVGLTMRM